MPCCRPQNHPCFHHAPVRPWADRDRRRSHRPREQTRFTVCIVRRPTCTRSRLLGPCFKTGRGQPFSPGIGLSSASETMHGGLRCAAQRKQLPRCLDTPWTTARWIGTGLTLVVTREGRLVHIISSSSQPRARQRRFHRITQTPRDGPDRAPRGAHGRGFAVDCGPVPGHLVAWRDTVPLGRETGRQHPPVCTLAGTHINVRKIARPHGLAVASGTLSSLCRVLFTIRSLYMCAIGLVSIFSLARGTPRNSNCIPKKLYSRMRRIKSAVQRRQTEQRTAKRGCHPRSHTFPGNLQLPPLLRPYPRPTPCSATGRSRPP